MRSLCLLCLGMVLLGCAAEQRAPIEDRAGRPAVDTGRPQPLPNDYTVSGGDTLFAIAWRYGLDYRSLASANNIKSPYTIYPGQKLSLKGPAPSAARSKPRKTASAPVPPAPVTKTSPAPAKTSSADYKPAPNAKVGAWRWPTTGKVVRGFSGTVHKGIDIDGKAGDKVRATAAGRVVYAGSGIVGYGKLLIIKHNDVYLSAYGHNRKLLAGEGEDVSTGQVIAEKGSSATNSVKLHFEIRREGKPIDPKKLLPAR